MTTPRRITKEQAEENKRKQQILRENGYNITVDGSWGPWQEKQYRKIISTKRDNLSQANAAALAIPAIGYGLASSGIAAGSLAGSTLTLPLALALAPIAYDTYMKATGKGFHPGLSYQERYENSYLPNSTMVRRPIVVSRYQSRPASEMDLTTLLTRNVPLSISLDMASEANTDSAAVAASAAQQDSITPVSQSNPQKPQEDKKDENDDKNKDKKDNRYKKTLSEVGEFYKNLLNKSFKYTLKSAPFLALTGWGAYKGSKAYFSEDPPTSADNILTEQQSQIKELEKYNQIKQNQAIIDSMRRAFAKPVQSNSVSVGDTVEAGSGDPSKLPVIMPATIFDDNPY